MLKEDKTKAWYLQYYNDPSDLVDPDENNFIKESEMKKFAWPVFILAMVLILGTGLTGCETLHSAVEIVRENICN